MSACVVCGAPFSISRLEPAEPTSGCAGCELHQTVHRKSCNERSLMSQIASEGPRREREVLAQLVSWLRDSAQKVRDQHGEKALLASATYDVVALAIERGEWREEQVGGVEHLPLKFQEKIRVFPPPWPPKDEDENVSSEQSKFLNEYIRQLSGLDKTDKDPDSVSAVSEADFTPYRLRLVNSGATNRHFVCGKCGCRTYGYTVMCCAEGRDAQINNRIDNSSPLLPWSKDTLFDPLAHTNCKIACSLECDDLGRNPIEPDYAERAAQAWLWPNDEYENGNDDPAVASLANLIREAKAQGRLEGIEEAAIKCDEIGNRYFDLSNGSGACTSDIHKSAAGVECARSIRKLAGEV